MIGLNKTTNDEWESEMKGIGQLGNKKLQYLEVLEKWAKNNAKILKDNKNVAKDLLAQLKAIYKATGVEKEKYKNDFFELAYQQPVTSDFEFLVARTIYHFGKDLSPNWKVFLRRQFNSLAPDIRIEIGGRTIGIVEVKVSLGWVRHLFWSPEKIEEMRKRSKKSWDAEEAIQAFKLKLDKYKNYFEVPEECFFFLVPTLCDVKNCNKQNFTKNSGLSQENLVLLSEDQNYHSAGKRNEPSCVTQYFNMMVNKLKEQASLHDR